MAEQQTEHAASAGYRVRWTERSSGVVQGQWCGSWLGAQLVARRLSGRTSIVDVHITDAAGVARFAVLAQAAQAAAQVEGRDG